MRGEALHCQWQEPLRLTVGLGAYRVTVAAGSCLVVLLVVTSTSSSMILVEVVLLSQAASGTSSTATGSGSTAVLTHCRRLTEYY